MSDVSTKIVDGIAIRSARLHFPEDIRLHEGYAGSAWQARLARRIVKAVNASPDTTKRSVKLPVMGSLNEPLLEEQGWRMVRDSETGDALFLEAVSP